MMEIKVIAVALTTNWEGIRRSKNSMSFFPDSVDLIDCSKIASVVVLIPPPVEPGDAPINIKRVIP